MLRPARHLVLPLAVVAGLGAEAFAADPPVAPPFPAAPGEAATVQWLKQYTSVGTGRYVVFGPDVVVVVLADEVVPSSPWLHRLSFRREAIKPEFVARTGGRSLRASGELDCSTGSFKVETTELYSGADLTGTVVSRVEPGTLTRPQPGSSFADMVVKVCAARPGGPAATTTLAARAPPSRAPSSPPATRPVVAPAPAPRLTAARPSPSAAVLARAAPAPPTKAAPATPPAARPGAGTDLVVQIGAFDSRALAEGAWRRLSGLFPAEFAGKSMQMQPVKPKGATLYRTWVTGFADAAAVRAACAKLSARGEPCLVRRAPQS